MNPDLALQWALHWAAHGIPVFSLRDDKAPYTPNGFHDASVDPDVVRRMWAQHPGAIIGGYLGAANIVAYDIDVKDGKRGDDEWAAMEEEYGKLPDTVRVLTPSGGWHVWFDMGDTPIGTVNGWTEANAPAVDVKGLGGYVVLPPSVMPDGRAYTFEHGHDFFDDGRPVRVVPWLAELSPPPPGERRELVALDPHNDANRRMIEILSLHFGAHSARVGYYGEIRMTRPGKAGGTSVTIGHPQLGPGTVKIFSSSWPPFVTDRNYTPWEIERLAEVPSAWDALNHLSAAPPLPPLEPPADDIYIDWPTFWSKDRTMAEWLYEDVLAKGRGHSVYAAHKVGKSLLMLWIAAKVATTIDNVAVIYLDYEMGEDDVYERLESMGYGPESDLRRLQYAVLPSLPSMDTLDGARALSELLDRAERTWPGAHVVVVFDTTSRAVAGEENDADTYRDFYRHAGLLLKQRRATWARLDHAGKDAGKGQRGSSAKGDDVDVVWQVAKTDTGLELRRSVSRMSWVPERVAFDFSDEHGLVATKMPWPAGTAEMARLMDEAGLPAKVSYNAAMKILRPLGKGGRKEIVLAAMKFRLEEFIRTNNSSPGVVPGNPGTSGNHFIHRPEIDGSGGG